MVGEFNLRDTLARSYILSCRRNIPFKLQTIHHQIYKEDVDGWSSAEPISCDVTLAAQEDPNTAEFLHYPVEIEGIYPEGQTISIQQRFCSPG